MTGNTDRNDRESSRMIEFTVISLFVILLLAYYTMGRNWSRPSMLYVGGFLACAIVAYAYKIEWGLYKMSPYTVGLLVGGAFAFYLCEWYSYRRYPLNIKEVIISSDEFNSIRPIRLILFLFFQIIVYYLMAKAKMAYAMTSELDEALVEINNETKFENNLVKLPFYIQQPYNLCNAARALWCVLFPYYLFKSKRYNYQKILIFANLVCALVGTLLSGGRTAILYDIVSIICFGYICFQYKNRWKGGLFPRKVMVVIIMVGITFSLFFVELGYAIGRKESEDPINIILSVYCGAEIKNLDDYIQYPFKQGNESGLPAQYTMCGMYDKAALRFDNSSESRKFDPDLRFNSYGNYPLGNVYTTYYHNMLDFGFVGTIIWTCFLSFVISFLYRKVLKSRLWQTGYIDIWTVYYASFIPAACFLSFFSNKLTEGFTISGTIRTLIYWWVIIIFFQGRSMYNHVNAVK